MKPKLSPTQIKKEGFFEDFEVGRQFDHHWGRTINEGDNSIFVALCMIYNPLYFNKPYAQFHGHPNLLICPMLVFNIVFGLSVEDLSENGVAFLGMDDLTFVRPVYPGDTLTASSTVILRRDSKSRSDVGIVKWLTEGVNQAGERVIDFKRSNLVLKRDQK